MKVLVSNGLSERWGVELAAFPSPASTSVLFRELFRVMEDHPWATALEDGAVLALHRREFLLRAITEPDLDRIVRAGITRPAVLLTCAAMSDEARPVGDGDILDAPRIRWRMDLT